jgi:Zn-dependent protease
MTAPRRHDTPFGTGIPLGRYGGVQVSAHWSVLVILAWLTDLLAVSVLPDAAPRHATAVYLAVAVVVAVVFLAGLLAHELAHALVARHYGMPVPRIMLWMLGGMAERAVHERDRANPLWTAKVNFLSCACRRFSAIGSSDNPAMSSPITTGR